MENVSLFQNRKQMPLRVDLGVTSNAQTARMLRRGCFETGSPCEAQAGLGLAALPTSTVGVILGVQHRI